MSKRWFLVHKYFILHLLILLPCKTHYSSQQLLKLIYFWLLVFLRMQLLWFHKGMVYQKIIHRNLYLKKKRKLKNSCSHKCHTVVIFRQISFCFSSWSVPWPSKFNDWGTQFHELQLKPIWVRPPSRSLISTPTWTVFYTGNAFH